MTDLLSVDDVNVLTVAQAILDRLSHAATKAAMNVLGDADASPDSFDLGCLAQAANAGRSELQTVLIVAKVFGGSEEAGAVL